MKKSRAKQVSKGVEFMFSLDEPWDTLKAQILSNIEPILWPKHLNYDDYNSGFSLSNEQEFEGMVKQAKALTTKNPSIHLAVFEKEKAAPTADPNNENDKPEPAKKKTKKQGEADAILPGNKKKINHIKALHECWICKKPDLACPSPHYYIVPTTEEHLPLNPDCFDCWASALKPPNHKLFDEQSKSMKSVTAAPVFNFSIGNEVLGLFRHISGAPAAAQTHEGPYDLGDQLLPSTRAPGPNMPLDKFCTAYHLSANILAKILENKYTNAPLLHFVTIPDLKLMRFELGEIAALRDAAEKWSVHL
ncbi:hypothetical protein V8E55_010506 [Tylopilus felleus]